MTIGIFNSRGLGYAATGRAANTCDMSIENIPPAIDINRVTKAFERGKHQVTAIRELSLVIPVGEVVALVGANGAGKTTLFDMVLGLTKPTTGTIKVFGGPPAQAARTSRMGAVLQTGGLLPDLTVAETVRAIAGLHALDVPLTRAVEQVLE